MSRLSRRAIIASAAALPTLAVQAVALTNGRLAGKPTNAAADATTEAIAAVMKCLDDFMNAWNAHDLKALHDAMNFPHVRLNGDNALRVSFPSDMTQEIFERMQKTVPSIQGWHHSGWAKREIVAASPNKVHIQTRFVRYRADNSVLSSFDALYVVTKENGHWGVRMRSSFAP